MKKNVVAMSFDLETWKDVHLLKDCGLIPYYFHRLYGYDVTMVGAQIGEYPSLYKYIDGIKLEFVAENSYEARVEYVIANAEKIDLLILEGVYSVNLIYAREYKKRNPNGKIYLQTDMNSGYNEWVFSACPELVSLSEYVDVIASSGRRMQDLMNRKLPWCVEYIPNGYFDEIYTNNSINFDSKKNIILSVGRLGTWQKATEILLESFLSASKYIPDWELHLVGTIEKEFEQHIKEFFKLNPFLQDRVIFCGPIYDKHELANKFTEAKVFALPSRFEGGTPNVISEALISGCAILVAEFDAYNDAIDDGRCGMSVKIDDVDGLAESIIELCNSKKLMDICIAANKYAQKNYDYKKIIKRLHYLLYGEC